MIEIEVFSIKNRPLGKIRIPINATVKYMKVEVAKQNKQLYVERQSVRTDLKGRDLKDNLTAANLNIRNGSKIYIKDLGPQISWRLVFLVEYLGPLIVYLIFTTRPWIIYGNTDDAPGLSITAQIAAACWTAHYAKRVLETIYVHRFSHSTMPLMNLFKNCGYYWGFTAYVAYHVNHPLYTPPIFIQAFLGLSSFVISELGNLSIHLLLRDLRPPGTTVRKIPVPNGNFLTGIFDYVSCPNYTYEYAAWIGFAMLTNCLPALLFAFAGMYQMSMWAFAKHNNYIREFPNYPKQRMAIVPYIF